jgi:hypothetical protein
MAPGLRTISIRNVSACVCVSMHVDDKLRQNEISELGKSRN